MTKCPTPAQFKVMLALHAANDGLYGLEIVRRSRGKIPRGSVYTLLLRLQQIGMVYATKPAADGRPGMPRPRYKLTKFGRRFVDLLNGQGE
jgi:hypothetical protein